MPARSTDLDLAARLASIVAEHAASTGSPALRERLEAFARDASPEELVSVAQPHRDEPDVIAPLYEAVVQAQPDNARALVILANAWWLQGRGPQAVGELAARAIAADPANRGAWHLWALSESDPRNRLRRWQQVCDRFPADDLALAAAADNAAALAGAEKDYDVLDLAVETYERLLARASEPTQRDAVSAALRVLKEWRF